MPDEPFPKTNAAKAVGKESIVDVAMQDTWIMKQCATEIKMFFTFLTAGLAFLAWFLFA